MNTNSRPNMGGFCYIWPKSPPLVFVGISRERRARSPAGGSQGFDTPFPRHTSPEQSAKADRERQVWRAMRVRSGVPRRHAPGRRGARAAVRTRRGAGGVRRQAVGLWGAGTAAGAGGQRGGLHGRRCISSAGGRGGGHGRVWGAGRGVWGGGGRRRALGGAAGAERGKTARCAAHGGR